MYKCPKCKAYILTRYCTNCKDDIDNLDDGGIFNVLKDIMRGESDGNIDER